MGGDPGALSAGRSGRYLHLALATHMKLGSFDRSRGTMSNERVFRFDIGAEVECYFDDSSVPRDEEPRVVILMGGTGSGKTEIRKQQFSRGSVLVDAAEVFLNLSRGEFFPFPDGLEQPSSWQRQHFVLLR